MSASTGLARLAQVIDWVFMVIAAFFAFIAAAIFLNNQSALSILFAIIAVISFGIGKAVRYVINGFAT